MFNLNYCIMKTIGLLGVSGMETMTAYLHAVTKFVRDYTCYQEEPQLVLSTLDFQRVKKLRKETDWTELFQQCANIINFDLAATEIVLLCSNEIHKGYDKISDLSEIDILSIVDTTVGYVAQQNYQKVLLLGTLPTMSETFYVSALNAQKVEVVVPGEAEQREIDRIILDELSRKIVCEKSREYLFKIIQRAKSEDGIQAVILASTELPIILTEALMHRWVRLPYVDTLRVHAEAAVKFALGLS